MCPEQRNRRGLQLADLASGDGRAPAADVRYRRAHRLGCLSARRGEDLRNCRVAYRRRATLRVCRERSRPLPGALGDLLGLPLRGGYDAAAFRMRTSQQRQHRLKFAG
jgi:hypothetical protein